MEHVDKALPPELGRKPEPHVLHKLPLFSALADEALAKFSDLTETVLLGAGQTIYRIGDVNCPMYMVLVGKIRLSTTDRYGKRIILAYIAPGEVLGELPDTGDVGCSATVVAMEDTRLLVLDRNNLGFLFSVQPDKALQLIGALEARLRQLHSVLRHTA